VKNRIIHIFSSSKVIFAATIPMLKTQECHCLSNCICYTVIPSLLGSYILLSNVFCV